MPPDKFAENDLDASEEDVYVFPTSFAQERLWFLDQFDPGNSTYNIPVAWRISGPLDVAALKRSLNEIVQRHEALRTTFDQVDDQPAQLISPELKLDLPVLPGSGPAWVQQQVDEEAQRPFDLARGPLLRAKLLKLNDQEHVLLLGMHHIVSDGWSLGVLARELATFYQAFVSGQPAALSPLPIQYADFAAWQRDWLQGEALESQLAYWRQKLDGKLPLIELPTDRPRPPVQAYRGATHWFVLPRTLADALETFSRQEECTLFMTLLAAFKVLLHRYAGQSDIILGTPIANRNRVEIQELIGFFVNTLVLRTDLSGNPTFRELLDRVRTVTLEAYDYQDLPFEKLVEELQPQRDLSYNPLFQVLFALQNTPASPVEFPGLSVEPLRTSRKTSAFDLSLSMQQAEDGLVCSIEYNTDLFDADTIKRMLGHYQTLLQGIVADPDQRLAGLPLLTPGERHQLLHDWNDTRGDYSRHACVHELFEAQAARTPDDVAVVFEGERLTYRELDARANQLAHYLQGLGVGPDRLVGLCVERSLDMIVGLLGVLKAGGAYLPLDPGYPQERLAFMLEDAQVHVLLTTSRQRDALPAHSAHVVYLDADRAEIARQSETRPHSTVSARNLVYVLFTSGSTGRPKGVAIEHRSAVAMLHWVREVFSPQDLAGMLASTSLSFDLAVFELFGALSWGGCVFLAENALQLPAMPAAQQVTLVNTVPSVISQLLRSGDLPPSVRTVNLAGEPLLARVVDQLYEYPSIQRVFDLYGPSEDTTYSTFALRQAGGPETIGRPIRNTQVYLLDENLEPVPVGVRGELYVGGEGLARGYLNRPALTANSFIPNPFGEPGSRLYKTGDLARYLPDGDVQFIGRVDHQVKLRGFRIELGEIEAALRQHPALKETVVLAREDLPGEDKRLVAYIVLEGEAPEPSVSELRGFLKRGLPDYMLPSAFVALEALPLTPNGKVDRQALPLPDAARPRLGEEYVAPSTPYEEILVEVWQEVLGLEKIGVHDNFFDLGGHSLLATQVTSRVRDRFEIEWPVRALFEAPTIAEMGERVEQALIAEIEALDEDELRDLVL